MKKQAKEYKDVRRPTSDVGRLTSHPSAKHKHGSDPSKQYLGAGWLIAKGARTHNLKNITVAMPRGAMRVNTGLWGSGKSWLVFDQDRKGVV